MKQVFRFIITTALTAALAAGIILYCLNIGMETHVKKIHQQIQEIEHTIEKAGGK